MPPRRKCVPSLNIQISSFIEEVIIKFLEHHVPSCDYCFGCLESECPTILRAHKVFATNLSNNLKNQILSNIRYGDFSKNVASDIKQMSIRILFNNSSEDVTVFSWSELQAATFLNKKLKCARIRMNEIVFNESMPDLMSILANNCQFINKLCFGDLEIDSAMLGIIGRNCHNLAHLSAALTDNLKLDYLLAFCFSNYPDNTKLNPCCSKITTLEIPTTVNFNTTPSYDNGEANKDCICEFFSYFPNLRALYYLRAGHVFLHLLKTEKSFSENLTYFQDLKPTPSILKALPVHCKNIIHLNLLRIDQESLECIYNFQNLKFLELSLTKCHGISGLLSKVGQQLQILKLIMGDHLGLTDIARYCTKLTSLTIGAGSMYSYETKLNFPTSLEAFEVVQRWHTRDSTKLHHVTSHMPGLLYLKLWFGIVDEDLKMLLSNGTIGKLRTLRIIRTTGVKLKTLRDLIYSSPDLLEMGDLKSFAATEPEKMEFLETLKKDNVGVKIVN